MLQYEMNAFVDRCTREFNEFITAVGVRRPQGFVGTNGFTEVLLALAVLRKDIAPRRSDEYLSVITERLDCFLDMFRDGLIEKAQIPPNVWHSAIKEDNARCLLRHLVRTDFPAEHEFGEEKAVVPRQSTSPNGYLLLNDAASRFDGTLIFAALECIEERTLPGTRSPRNYEEAICVIHGFSLKVCRKSGRTIVSGRTGVVAALFTFT